MKGLIWPLLCIVLVASPASVVAQAPPRVLVSTSDELGVRVENLPAVLIDTDKVVIPSLYQWGATEYQLSYDDEQLEVTKIYELQGRYLSVLVFEPPLPSQAVRTIERKLELGQWLRRDGEMAADDDQAGVRLLHLAHGTWTVSIAATPDVEAAAGSAFCDEQGALVGILDVPALWHPSYPESMTLVAGRELAYVVERMNEDGSISPQPVASWQEDSDRLLLSQWSRLFLDQEAGEDALTQIAAISQLAAKWNETDTEWTSGLPQELYSVLFTMVAKNRLAPLQKQMIANPPELRDSGPDRFRLMNAGTNLQYGQVEEGVAELRAIVEEGGPGAYLAYFWMAQTWSQVSGQPERPFQFIQLAAEEFDRDPGLFELGAQLYARHVEHGDDRVTERFVDVSKIRQGLDWSVSASLAPATKLLEWEMYTQAVEFARTGVERWPDDADCREVLVKALVGMGDIEAAREHVAELRQRDPERAARLVESIPSLGDQ